jgi:hypothetical protein
MDGRSVAARIVICLETNVGVVKGGGPDRIRRVTSKPGRTSLLVLLATGTAVIVVIGKIVLVHGMRLYCHLEVVVATVGRRSRHSRSMSAVVGIRRRYLIDKV